mgnify:CR=1 FL=1
MALVNIEDIERLEFDVMQNTHEEEITMLNEIDELATKFETDATLKDELEEKMEAYVDHVIDHFENEERLMLVHNFSGYAMHKSEHDNVLKRFDEAYIPWKKEGDIWGMVTFLRSTTTWIKEHIAAMDTMTSLSIIENIAEMKKG